MDTHICCCVVVDICTCILHYHFCILKYFYPVFPITYLSELHSLPWGPGLATPPPKFTKSACIICHILGHAITNQCVYYGMGTHFSCVIVQLLKQGAYRQRRNHATFSTMHNVNDQAFCNVCSVISGGRDKDGTILIHDTSSLTKSDTAGSREANASYPIIASATTSR